MDKSRPVNHSAFPVTGDSRFNVRPNSGMSIKDAIFLALLSGEAARNQVDASKIEDIWELATKALEIREKYK